MFSHDLDCHCDPSPDHGNSVEDRPDPPIYFWKDHSKKGTHKPNDEWAAQGHNCPLAIPMAGNCAHRTAKVDVKLPLRIATVR